MNRITPARTEIHLSLVKIPVVVDRRVWRRGQLVRETTVLTQCHAFSAVFKKSV
jgi:hypothetical protein